MIAPEYLTPFIVSNVVALLLLVVAWRWPRAARYTFAVIFLAAGLFNLYTVFTNPASYTMYGELAMLPIYRAFINGVFAQHTAWFVAPIALGQLVISALLFVGGRMPLTLGALGASLFLLGIAPLGVGSAFPFSLIAIAALVIMVRRLNAAPTDAPRMAHMAG